VLEELDDPMATQNTYEHRIREEQEGFTSLEVFPGFVPIYNACRSKICAPKYSKLGAITRLLPYF
jgi:hypothetical protein